MRFSPLLMQFDSGNVDQAIFAGQRHRRLGTILGQRIQPRATTAAQHQGDDIAHAWGSSNVQTSMKKDGNATSGNDAVLRNSFTTKAEGQRRRKDNRPIGHDELQHRQLRQSTRPPNGCTTEMRWPPYLITKFTMRPGTTITLTTVLPASNSAIRGRRPGRPASCSSLSAPVGTRSCCGACR